MQAILNTVTRRSISQSVGPSLLVALNKLPIFEYSAISPERNHRHLPCRTISLRPLKPRCFATDSASSIAFCAFAVKRLQPAEDARPRVPCLLACLPHPCFDLIRLRKDTRSPFACLSAPVGLHLSSITSQEDLDQRRPGYRSLQSIKPSPEQYSRLHIDNHAIQGATAPDAFSHRWARGSVLSFGSYGICGG